MAKQANTRPTGDQPRVSTEQLKRLSGPNDLQYRVSGIKTFNVRTPRKTGRATRS